MRDISDHEPIIQQTERGLTVAGTRITLYDIMDYLAVQWPPRLIRDRLNLTDQQIDAALTYIAEHRDHVEREYQLVLEIAEENKRYWEAVNRERFARIAATREPLTKEHLREKVRARQSAEVCEDTHDSSSGS